MEELAWEYHVLCELFDQSIGLGSDPSTMGRKLVLSNRHASLVKHYLVQKFLIDPECRHLYDDEVGRALRQAISRTILPFAEAWKNRKRDKS